MVVLFCRVVDVVYFKLFMHENSSAKFKVKCQVQVGFLFFDMKFVSEFLNLLIDSLD